MKHSDWNNWWDKRSVGKAGTEFLMKHYFRNIFAKHVKREVGCRSGYIASKLFDDGYNITGMDYSKDAPSFNKNCKFRFILGDITDKSLFEKELNMHFELVYSQGVMEHYADDEFMVILIFIPSNLSLFQIYDPIKDDKHKRFLFEPSRRKRLEEI